jgi:hypothetical protein
MTTGSEDLDQELAANVIGRKRPERLRKTMANTSRYIRTDRRSQTKWGTLSSNKSTRSGKESYLKTRCLVWSSLQLLVQQTQNSDNNGLAKHDISS